VRPTAGSETPDRTPAIEATVRDKQTNLAKANITLSLDGNAIPRKAFFYDTVTDRLNYTPANNLSFGRRAVQIVARDEMGLRATKGWSFKVTR
jgi:thermitase